MRQRRAPQRGCSTYHQSLHCASSALLAARRPFMSHHSLLLARDLLSFSRLLKQLEKCRHRRGSPMSTPFSFRDVALTRLLQPFLIGIDGARFPLITTMSPLRCGSVKIYPQSRTSSRDCLTPQENSDENSQTVVCYPPFRQRRVA